MTEESTEANTKSQWASPIENRITRANYHFVTVLENQRQWYSDNAGKQKRRHLFFTISVISLGAAIACLQVFEAAAWVRYLTAVLGAAVAVLKAVDSVLRPGEAWQGYRKASESMKREYRLYINNADVYNTASDEELAYRLFVERLEAVLAEEQQLFWQYHAKNPLPQPTVQVETD